MSRRLLPSFKKNIRENEHDKARFYPLSIILPEIYEQKSTPTRKGHEFVPCTKNRNFSLHAKKRVL